jgi:tetratricopeptide (TPR) repeat protein
MRRPLLILSAVAALGAVSPAMAQAQGQPLGEGFAGSYLAARAAVMDGNHRAAAVYFETALAADPGNAFLIGNAIFANAALGQWRRADTIADMLDPADPGSEMVNLVRMVRRLAENDLVAARAAIEAGEGAGPFIDGLALGWIALGEGDMRRATEAFRQVAADEVLADIALTHLALARAAVGDFEGADAILSGAEFGSLSVSSRSIQARAEILVQLDRSAEALEFIDFFTASVPDPGLLALRDSIASQSGPRPYGFLTTAQQGLAEVFHSIAHAMGREAGSNTLPLLYARAAHGIDPGHTEAVILAGQLLGDARQFGLAAEAFDNVPEDDPHHVEAQLGRADALFDDGRSEDAVAALQALSRDHGDFAPVQAALGDALRRTDRCADAVTAYTAALDLVDITQSRNWFLYFARGICHEALDDFDASEADFRQALVLNPEQPQVLNNLGYSLVEQRRNLDEALAMIERAVEGDPDSGYIVDSLGWVLYRLGRFEEAVAPMERAVALLPNDPIINDHLGDVYWMVGRRREARFQWERALSFDPEEAEALRIRRKLEIGLDAVLVEEGGVGETQ